MLYDVSIILDLNLKAKYMMLQTDPSSWHHFFKLTHSVISVTFLINSFWVIIRSVRGFTKNKPYVKLDKILSYAFIVNLYLQLVFGFILFAGLGSTLGYDYTGALPSDMASKRMWPIEHIVLMLFALFIANLGLIISLKTSVDREKHQKILLYYIIALLMITLSLSINYFF